MRHSRLRRSSRRSPDRERRRRRAAGSELKFTVVPGSSGVESVWCKIYVYRNSIAVRVFDCTAGSSIDALHSLNQLMNEHISDFRNLILMNDLNTSGINWHSLTASGREVNICNALTDTTLSFGI